MDVHFDKIGACISRSVIICLFISHCIKYIIQKDIDGIYVFGGFRRKDCAKSWFLCARKRARAHDTETQKTQQSRNTGANERDELFLGTGQHSTLLSFPLIASSFNMGQSLNGPAVRALGTVVCRPRLALPDISCANVGALDFAGMKRAGIRALVLDKDNTLTAPYAMEVHSECAEGVHRMMTEFTVDQLGIVSNSAGSSDDRDGAEARKVESMLGIPVVVHGTKKPDGFESIMRHFNSRRAEEEPIMPHQVACIGDRLLTDVVFGNLHGMVTVHVEPLTLKGDNLPAAIVRSLENRIIKPLLLRLLDVRNSSSNIREEDYLLRDGRIQR